MEGMQWAATWKSLYQGTLCSASPTSSSVSSSSLRLLPASLAVSAEERPGMTDQAPVPTPGGTAGPRTGPVTAGGVP